MISNNPAAGAAGHTTGIKEVKRPSGPTQTSGTHHTPGESLQVANHLVSAPGAAVVKAHPLDVIPRDWLPEGRSERQFSGYTGFVKVMGGKAQIDRNQDHVSIVTPYSDFAFRPDPAHAGGVLVNTPKGVLEGHLQRVNDKRLEFRTTDGEKGVTIEKKSDGIRFDTHGFGAMDMGHLNVSNH